jgi:hypothetical protein
MTGNAHVSPRVVRRQAYELRGVGGEAHRLGELAIAVGEHQDLVGGLLVLAPCAMTKGSLTEMQAMVSTPFSLIVTSSLVETAPPLLAKFCLHATALTLSDSSPRSESDGQNREG